MTAGGFALRRWPGRRLRRGVGSLILAGKIVEGGERAMQIVLNGQPEEVAAEITVGRLLEELELNSAVVTVTVNGAYLEKADLANRQLAAGDQVEVILFMGGGH